MKKSRPRAVPRKEFVVILYNIRSRFNVGSIFRTADAFGVQKIFLCGITPAPPHPKISKVALGAEKNIPFVQYKNLSPLLKILRAEGFCIAALEQAKTSRNLAAFRAPQKIALILGPEVTGLSKAILHHADTILEIPMLGKKESFNVSVAFGIAAYQIKSMELKNLF